MCNLRLDFFIGIDELRVLLRQFLDLFFGLFYLVFYRADERLVLEVVLLALFVLLLK